MKSLKSIKILALAFLVLQTKSLSCMKFLRQLFTKEGIPYCLKPQSFTIGSISGEKITMKKFREELEMAPEVKQFFLAKEESKISELDREIVKKIEADIKKKEKDIDMDVCFEAKRLKYFLDTDYQRLKKVASDFRKVFTHIRRLAKETGKLPFDENNFVVSYEPLSRGSGPFFNPQYYKRTSCEACHGRRSYSQGAEKIEARVSIRVFSEFFSPKELKVLGDFSLICSGKIAALTVCKRHIKEVPRFLPIAHFVWTGGRELKLLNEEEKEALKKKLLEGEPIFPKERRMQQRLQRFGNIQMGLQNSDGSFNLTLRILEPNEVNN